MKIFIDKLNHKLEIAKEDSDFTYFFTLLVVGEAVMKIIALTTASALQEDKDRQRYRILHGLVRANGIGDWSRALDDMLAGTASQSLVPEFRVYQAEMTKRVGDDAWQSTVVSELLLATDILKIPTQESVGKKDLKSWFKLFSELRNKTRGHGALNPGASSGAVIHLEKSIRTLMDNIGIFDIPSCYMKRNLSGKYRVTEISPSGDFFDDYKKTSKYNLDDGIYLGLGGVRPVFLMVSDSDLFDFYISNGGYGKNKYELLSYITDDKKYGESAEYIAPIGVLPPSESDGLGELVCKENVFTNVPSLSYDYVDRVDLEDQLFELLMNDHRPVITLVGRGGIGKTSLALKVIPRLYKETRFDAIVWFSSRDIDLHSEGIKLVTAEVVSVKDISSYYIKLVLSESEMKEKGFDFIQYFQKELTSSSIGPCLFVFDNFETTSNPIEVYKWLDTYIRLPNKMLITTRLREFLGDYPVSVQGMTEEQSSKLIKLTSRNLGVDDKISKTMIDDIYKVSGGHPYIIKIILGELSKNNMRGALPKIVASSDEVLTALFERTYSVITPCAQRVFLTLSSWNSAISRLLLESVLMKSIGDPIEVEKAIETIIQYSLAEEYKSDKDGQYFILLPYSALSFGEKKLKVSPLRGAITKDVKLLQKFGPAKIEKKEMFLLPHISTFFSNVESCKREFENHQDLLERIGRSYPQSLPLIARWLQESGDNYLIAEAKRYLYLFLERDDVEDRSKYEVWSQLSLLCRELNDPVSEVHAIIESSQYEDVEFSDLSNIANKVNHMLAKHDLNIDTTEEKREIISKLYIVMKKRKHEADANGLSRIAWLALHLGEEDEAKDLANQGLDIDPNNIYCTRLVDKLGS